MVLVHRRSSSPALPTAIPALSLLARGFVTYPLLDDILTVLSVLYVVGWWSSAQVNCGLECVRACEVLSDASLEINGPTKIVCQDFMGGIGHWSRDSIRSSGRVSSIMLSHRVSARASVLHYQQLIYLRQAGQIKPSCQDRPACHITLHRNTLFSLTSILTFFSRFLHVFFVVLASLDTSRLIAGSVSLPVMARDRAYC